MKHNQSESTAAHGHTHTETHTVERLELTGHYCLLVLVVGSKMGEDISTVFVFKPTIVRNPPEQAVIVFHSRSLIDTLLSWDQRNH